MMNALVYSGSLKNSLIFIGVLAAMAALVLILK